MDFGNYLGCGGGTKDTGIKLEQGHDLRDDQIELLVFEDAVIVELSFMASFSLPLHSTPIPSRPISSISPISKPTPKFPSFEIPILALHPKRCQTTHNLQGETFSSEG
ncbi:hypothetical protein ACFX2K_030772 [Malus domestica]